MFAFKILSPSPQDGLCTSVIPMFKMMNHSHQVKKVSIEVFTSHYTTSSTHENLMIFQFEFSDESKLMAE